MWTRDFEKILTDFEKILTNFEKILTNFFFFSNLISRLTLNPPMLQLRLKEAKYFFSNYFDLQGRNEN